MSVDWYRRKLGQAPQPQSTPDTWTLPRQTQPTLAYQPPPTIPVENYNAPEAAPEGQMHVGDAVVRWQGGDGTAEKIQCPKCGSRNYFSRQGQTLITKNGAAPPSPHCFDCGHNSIFTIFGGD